MCCFEEIYGKGAGYRKRMLLVSVLDRCVMTRRKEKETLLWTVCFFSLDLATSSRYARASLDDATDYATSLEW